MTWLISFVSPRNWWEWPLGVVFWGLVASSLAYGVELLITNPSNNDGRQNIIQKTLMTTPIVIPALALIRHLDKLQRRMARIAATDPLTGLSNRRAFLNRASRAGNGVLLMLDLDHFKLVNDRHGHAVGDGVLCAMASHMTGLVRATDIIGRIGGEEFALFLVNATGADAARVGECLAAGVVYQDPESDERVPVTASVGAVEVSSDRDVLALLRAADQALYAAKRAGRAQLKFQALNLAATDRIAFRSALIG